MSSPGRDQTAGPVRIKPGGSAAPTAAAAAAVGTLVKRVKLQSRFQTPPSSASTRQSSTTFASTAKPVTEYQVAIAGETGPLIGAKSLAARPIPRWTNAASAGSGTTRSAAATGAGRVTGAGFAS
jgi:hypothetical protein